MTGTFNSIALGDGIISSKQRIDRSIIKEDVAEVDAIQTRNRGGGELRIDIKFDKSCADLDTARNYALTTQNSFGNAKASLVLGGATWANMLCVSVEEDTRHGTYVICGASFEKSAQ